MTINHTIQNTWKTEGLLNVLPSFAIYHNNDMITKDYGFVVSWIIWSFCVEIWTD